MRGLLARTAPLAILALGCGLTQAQVAPNSNLLMPAWVMAPYGINPTSDCYWAKSLYYGNCTLTVSRASIGTYSDSSGNWYTAANNVARIGYGTGVWVEEARINSIRNNTMQGASSGVPPTNWGNGSAGIDGVSFSYGVPFIASGVNWIPITFSGTATGNSNSGVNQAFEGSTQIAATYGQTYSVSVFLYSSGGVIPGIVFDISERNSGGSAVVDGVSANLSVTTAPARFNFTYTLVGATTAYALPRLYFPIANGTTYSGTLYIGWPQLELNSINSSVASVTVNAGGTLYMPSSSGTVTWSGSGCTTNPVLNVTTSGAGVINAVTSVAAAGSCTTFPPSSATTWTDGTGLGTGSGASFNLVPTNNAAQGFATSPIPTTNAAVARAADAITYASPGTFCPGGYSMVAWGKPFAPTGYGTNQFLSALSDGTINNYSGLIRNSSSGNSGSKLTIGGVSQAIPGAGSVMAQAVLAKLAQAIAPGTQMFSENGSAPSSAAVASIPLISAVNVGSRSGSTLQFNGTIARTTLWNCTVLPAAALQSATNPNLFNFLLRRDVLPDVGNDNRPMWLEDVA